MWKVFTGAKPVVFHNRFLFIEIVINNSRVLLTTKLPKLQLKSRNLRSCTTMGIVYVYLVNAMQ